MTKKMRSHTSPMLEPIESGQPSAAKSSRRSFSKKDLVEAVRRLTPGGGMSDHCLAARSTNSFDAANEMNSTRRGPVNVTSPLALMEWGVIHNARKFNELRTQADRKATALKARLDDLRSLKTEQEALQKMCSAASSEATRIKELLRSIESVSDDIDRRLHYRRQLEQMLRRLQKNQVAISSHVNILEDAYSAAQREYKEMKGMLRQVEAGHTKAVLKFAEAQRLAKIENEERHRAMEQRKIESSHAARLDLWRQKREVARLEFASELRGDLSAEEEKKLQQTLSNQKKALLQIRSQHEVLQKEALSLELSFVAVRQATGVNSLDEVVEKFQSQEGNRRALSIEKREAEERLANAKRAKEELENHFADLQNSGVGNVEMSREISEELQREINNSRIKLKASNATCERLESSLVALRQGAIGLFQRLRPFAHLLEGEGSLPTAAMLSGAALAGPGAAGSSPTAPDLPAIDPIDAIHLSEIMLSKMVEIISGGDHGHSSTGIISAGDATADCTTTSSHPDDSAVEDAIEDCDGSLPNPLNNVRVPTVARRLENEVLTFITEGDGPGAEIGENVDARHVDDNNEDTTEGVAILMNVSAETLENMVPNRSFLKLSSSRQYNEMLRRQEQEARKRRMMERMELAEEIDRAAISSRAARKKAQAEATNRLSSLPSTTPPPTRIKESAIERSVETLSRVPELE